MKPLVIAPSGRVFTSFPALGSESGLEVKRVQHTPALAELDIERPTVIIVDAQMVSQGQRAAYGEIAPYVAFIGVGEPGEVEPSDTLLSVALTSWLAADASPGQGNAALMGALRHASSLVEAFRASRLEQASSNELRELSRVGAALATEKNLDSLLALILDQALRLSAADAGSLYLAERNDARETPTTLRFKLSRNITLPDLPFSESTVAIDDTSLAGHVAASGNALMIADVYLLPEHVPYRLNRSFDEKFGYRTKSMLVLPMRNHKDAIIGVLQLINRKRSPQKRLATPTDVDAQVVPFDQRSADLVAALAAQAAVAIENSQLYEDIERLFEGFVTAAVTAIESRDPTTSGHSFRVATFTTGLAEAVDRGGTGPYKDISFTREQLRELRYAGLLHDFGKVGVREQVLVKQKKLYNHDLAIVKHRFHNLLLQADLDFERARAEILLGGRDSAGADRSGTPSISDLESARRSRKEKLQQWVDLIVKSNEPTILPEGSFDALTEISNETYVDFDGSVRPLLSDDELRFLMLRKGNLDERERREIESHVTHTYKFLEQIPWTRELRDIPRIAVGHHEKLNGTGYPHGVGAAEIPIQTRIMTIADIFDALTATDRPYKRAVPAERALDILGAEAKGGQIDEHLLTTFVQAEVFRVIPTHHHRGS